MKWIKASERLPENWNPDFYFYHLRYVTDHVKVDTDLFEMSELGLIKKGGTGFLPFSGIEWLDESAVDNGWVSVAEGFPNEGGRYLCYCESVGELGKSYFQWNCAYDPQTKSFHDFSYSFKDGERVTHWQPLPPAPAKS